MASPECDQKLQVGFEEVNFDAGGDDMCHSPGLRVSCYLNAYLARLLKPLPVVGQGIGKKPGPWPPMSAQLGTCREDDMAALAERLAASMMDDECWSFPSTSEHYNSASSSEEGSPRAWYLGCKGSPLSSRPTSPAWSSSSYERGDHHFDLPRTVSSESGHSQDHYQTCSPNSVLSSQKSSFQTAAFSQSDLVSLQQQLENLSAEQLQALRKALAESRKVRRDTRHEKHGRRVPEGGVNWGHDRHSDNCEQVPKEAERKEAERRAIAVLASQQPNERLAPDSRASRRSVVCRREVPPPKPAPMPTPRAHGKEGGTGVFLPMVLRTSGTASVLRSKSVPAPLQLPARVSQYQPSRQAPIPTHRAFNGQQNLAANRTASGPQPNVAVVDCSEVAKIPVVSFNQRARAQPVPTASEPPTREVRQPSSATNNAPVGNYRAGPSKQTVPAAYGSYKEFVPQQRQWAPPGAYNQVDSLGLPEEWIY